MLQKNDGGKKNFVFLQPLLKMAHGKLAEWLKAAVSKTAEVSQLPGVRIPHFPLNLFRIN
jgi:hypothetical protein